MIYICVCIGNNGNKLNYMLRTKITNRRCHRIPPNGARVVNEEKDILTSKCL